LDHKRKKGFRIDFIHKPCQRGAKRAKISKIIRHWTYFQKGGGATDTRKALRFNVEMEESKI
jgi:hypothetical protein